MVHENTGVRQEFVRSAGSRRELSRPAAFGVAEGELAIRIQVRGDYEWFDVLPFQNERGYLSLDERDGLLVIGQRSGTASASEPDDVLFETSLSARQDKAPESGPRFDLEASGVPKNATILSARVLGGGMNQDMKEQAERWLAEPESNRGFAELQRAQSATASQAQMVVEWVDNTSMVYYLKDHLGSVRATVDDINLVNKFTGKERDTDFGLDWDYFGARYYHAGISRWLTVDPKNAEYPGLSPYNYTINNPAKYIDPDGEGVFLAIAAGALIGAFIADAIDPNPANAPSEDDVASGRIEQGKSDLQFAGEEALGAGIGGVATKLASKVPFKSLIGKLLGKSTDFNVASAIKGLNKGELQRLNVANDVKLGKISAADANQPLSKGGSAIKRMGSMKDGKVILVQKQSDGTFLVTVRELANGRVVNTSTTQGTAKELGIKNLEDLGGLSNHFLGREKE